VTLPATAKRPTRRGSVLLGQLLMGCGEPLRVGAVRATRTAFETPARLPTGRLVSVRVGRGGA
jgi:hypothetical protein